jgi:hypothetical protein
MDVAPKSLLKARRGHDPATRFPRQESSSVPVKAGQRFRVNSFTLARFLHNSGWRMKSSLAIIFSGVLFSNEFLMQTRGGKVHAPH